MKDKIKASIIYKCPITNKKIQTEMSWRNNNLYIDCMESYDHSYSILLIVYKCKLCEKKHEIELN